jgi:branched-chain amino acid transport system permease protein
VPTTGRLVSGSVFLQQVTNGASLGLVYALAAIGVTLVFGILRVINFAHGEFYMLGAFLVSSCLALRLPYFPALIVAVVVVAVIGLLSERLTVRPLQGRHHFTVVLSTLGLSILLQNGALLVWGAEPRQIAPAWGSYPVVLGGVVLSRMRLVALVVGLLLILALTIFIRWTNVGLAMRAVARDPDAAALMGVDVQRICAFTFSVSCGLAAVSGGLLGGIFDIETTMGEWAVVKAFAVVIMGGLGNVPGAILGGIVLGVTESLGAAYVPGGVGYKDGIGFAILILVLLFRPQGLFGRHV